MKDNLSCQKEAEPCASSAPKGMQNETTLTDENDDIFITERASNNYNTRTQIQIQIHTHTESKT